MRDTVLRGVNINRDEFFFFLSAALVRQMGEACVYENILFFRQSFLNKVSCRKISKTVYMFSRLFLYIIRSLLFSVA